MKRFIVVGLGLFGSEVARSLYGEGHDVIAVDTDPRFVDEIGPDVTHAAVADAREAASLEALGAKACDAGVISIGTDVGASVLITLALRDLGIREIYAKVTSTQHARILEKLGATETIFPEHESAQRLAERLSTPGILRAASLGPGFSLREIAVPEAFRGKTLRDLELPRKHRIQVVAVRDLLAGTLNHIPDPDAVLKDSDTLIVIGEDDALDKLATE
ncbi:MAG: potassium channel family protein [Gemmatimonadota bacterium]